MRPKVFITRPIPEEVENYIAEYCDYQKWDSDDPISRSKLLKETVDIDGLLTAGEKIDQELLHHGSNLKIVSNMSVGYNNFDIDAMKKRNVLGTHTPSVLDGSVADLVFGLMLSAARRIPELDDYVKKGKWQDGNDTPLFGLDVHSTTLGIIGMGRIGQEVARRAKFGFNMNVIYHNRRRNAEVEKELDVLYSSLDDLLRESDYVVLLIPLTEETYDFMGDEQFNLMKESAIFINASRGRTVNELALINALENKKIQAAGLDVFYEEPTPVDNPLLRMPNVIALPHIGTATYKTRFDIAMLAAENLVAGLLGKLPPNIVKEMKTSSTTSRE